MNRLALFGISVAVSTAALSATITDAAINKALDDIKKRNSPRYLQFNHQRIVEEIESFAKTNELTYSQKATVTRRLAEHAAALKDGDAIYEKYFAELNALTNLQVKVGNLRSFIDASIHLYSFNREKGWGTAMRILDKDAGLFDCNYRMSKRADLAAIGVSIFRDREKARYDDLFKTVLDEPVPVGDSASTNRFSQMRGNRLRVMMQGLFPLGEDVAVAQFEKYKSEMSDSDQNGFLAELAKSYKEHNNRSGFDSVLARIKALPLEKRISPYCEILKTLNSFDRDLAHKLIEAELAQKLTPSQRQSYLAVKQGFFDPPIFNYGFNSPGQYGTWRKVILERIALEDSNKDDPGAKFFSNANGKVSEIDRMIWYDDLDTAEMLHARSIAIWPNDRALNGIQAKLIALRGDAKGAAAKLRANLSLKGVSANDTNMTLRIVAFLEGKGVRGFDEVNKSLGLTSAQRLTALRETSRELFKTRRYDDCRAIFEEITKNVYAPDAVKVHTATYVPNAPKTADGFVRTPMYNEWDKMETSFYPYGDCYGESADVDAKRHLKDVEQPKVNPEYRTGIRVTYDEDGVHVFIRCDDPKIEEVKLGKRNAGGLEMFFAPGNAEKPYHSIFFDALPGTDNPHDCEWAMPGPHYRRNVDSFTKDAALTADGVVAHLSIPWMSFYDDLPVDGNLWNLGCLRSSPAGLYTIAGIVHELGRGLKIRFDFTKQQLIDLKRRVSVQAFSRYNALRKNDGKFIKAWNDKLLGDPEFHEAVLAPVLEDLDAAGARLLAPCTDGEVDAIFTKYAPRWAGIEYEISKLRTDYINNKLFKE